MSKHKPTKNRISTDSSIPECVPAIDSQSDEQIELRTKNVVEFAKFSFELEEKREQSLLNQSSQMLTAFSIASAALLMAVPIIMENISVPKYKILITAGIVLGLLIISMILALLSQWRFRYATMMNGEELLRKIECDPQNHTVQPQYDYQWINQLQVIQDSKKKNNDKRYKLINASMITFFVALLALVICSLIIILS